MDTGILFISSDRVGLTERFPESFKRFVVPYGNKKVLSTKILEIHNYDIDEKNKLADNIRDFVSNFTWTNVTDAYIKIYYELKLK
jgi:glycosyltransferase involved in cell wall biosynthesis